MSFSDYFILNRIISVLLTIYKWGHFLMLLKRSMHLIIVQSWTYRHSVIINSALNSKLSSEKNFKLNPMWTWKLYFTYQSDINLHLFNFNTLYQMNEIYTGKKNHVKKLFQHELTWEYPKNLHFHYQSLQTARRLDNYNQLILYHKIRETTKQLPARRYYILIKRKPNSNL